MFKLTPPAAGHTQWTESVLHRFIYTDGYQPDAGLIFDGWAFFGTTAAGGLGGGTVFKLQ